MAGSGRRPAPTNTREQSRAIGRPHKGDRRVCSPCRFGPSRQRKGEPNGRVSVQARDGRGQSSPTVELALGSAPLRDSSTHRDVDGGRIQTHFSSPPTQPGVRLRSPGDSPFASASRPRSYFADFDPDVSLRAEQGTNGDRAPAVNDLSVNNPPAVRDRARDHEAPSIAFAGS